MFFLRKKNTNYKSLFEFTSSQFDKNSILVNYSKNTSKKLINYCIIGSKKIIIPLSKVLDYSVISICSIILYNLLVNKNIINV